MLIITRKESPVPNTEALRLCFLGDKSCGKSTLIGVLTEGKLDDGDGSARTAIFHHPHELYSGGTTSSISLKDLNFDQSGKPILTKDLDSVDDGNDFGRRRNEGGKESRESSKVVTFVDAPGQDRYMKTTVGGIMRQKPNYVLILQDSSIPLSDVTKKHYQLCWALDLHVVFCLTKIDLLQTKREKCTI
eukprot:UN27821